MRNAFLSFALLMTVATSSFAGGLYDPGATYDCKAESDVMFGDFSLTVKSKLPSASDLNDKTPNSEINIYLTLDGKYNKVDAVCFVNPEAEELFGCAGLRSEAGDVFPFFVISFHTGLMQAQLTQDLSGSGEFYSYSCKKVK